VRARVEGSQQIGELDVFEDDPVLICPWHGWEFRLHGGQCLTDAKLRVGTYPVEVRAGKVYVDLGRRPDRPGDD
jgi:nitrite reductase/ring-hydroxylating ferredoxin subunit